MTCPTGLRRAAFLLALHLLSLQAMAETAPDLSDKRGKVKIGIARFSGENLSPNQKTMVDTMPMRLKAVLEPISSRALGAEEREAYRSASLLAKILDIGKSLDEQLGQYDMKILSEKGPKETAASRKGLVAGIDGAKKNLETYSDFPLSNISVEKSKPVEWVKPSDSKDILDSPAVNARAFCVQQDLDILVSGSLRGSGEYVFLEIYAYHRFLDARIFEWKTALGEDDTQAALDEFSLILAEALLGRKTGVLRVTASPARAHIKVNGKFAGNSPSVTPFADSGSYEVSVSAPGYLEESATVTVAEGSDSSVAFELKALPLGSVSVQSDPDGAELYIDAAKAGETPLDLGQNGQLRSVRARKEGYKDSYFVIDGKKTGELKVPLVTLEESLKNSFSKQKDRFYYSAGAFMLSLPVSVLCAGMFNQYLSNAQSAEAGSSTAEQKEAARLLFEGQRNLWEMAAYGAGSLSVGLLGYTVYRFILYLQSS